MAMALEAAEGPRTRTPLHLYHHVPTTPSNPGLHLILSSCAPVFVYRDTSYAFFEKIQRSRKTETLRRASGLRIPGPNRQEIVRRLPACPHTLQRSLDARSPVIFKIA